MGNNNSSQHQQNEPTTNNQEQHTADMITLSPITIESTADFQTQNRKHKKLKSPNKRQTLKYHKTWDIINLLTYNEWSTTNSITDEYNFKNVNKIFSCNGKCQETCTNGFCLYSVNTRTQKKLLSNRKFNYYSSNDYRIKFRFKKFVLLNKKKQNYVRNSEASKIMDHFKYNHLPAMFSSFHHYNVKGLIKGNFNETDGSLLLINIYSEITEKTRFVLINLKTNKFSTIFGDYHGYISANDVYAEWSPDMTRLLLRINNSLSNDNDVLTAVPAPPTITSASFIDYYDISKRDGKLLQRFKYFHKTAIFTFDPTFKHSKLAITDFYQENASSIYIVDLNHDDKLTKILSCSQDIVSDLSRSACDIKFSLDGSYIVVTIGDNICCCRALPHSFSDCKYLIFNAYTCQLLKSFTSHLSTCTIHMCPLNYLPKISTCQTRMAIPKKHFQPLSLSTSEESEDSVYYNSAIKRALALNSTLSTTTTNNGGSTTNLFCSFPILKCSSNDLNSSNMSSNIDLTFIKIIHMPCNLSLKNLCRIVINRNIESVSLISNLPLPEIIKSYLLYSPQMV